MFDLSKLGDMTKIADQAKKMQDKQERGQKEQIELLKKISGQMDTVVSLLQERH